MKKTRRINGISEREKAISRCLLNIVRISAGAPTKRYNVIFLVLIGLSIPQAVTPCSEVAIAMESSCSLLQTIA
jgi:hypothetical protein